MELFKRLKDSGVQLRKSSFSPVNSLEDKHNFKRYYRLEKDGVVTERIFLDIPVAALREEVICTHYLSFLQRHFIEVPFGVNVLSRDNPWDFGLELSVGVSFNLEITSIADNTWLFKKMKREEEYALFVIKEKVTFRELKKMYKALDDPKIEAAIEKLKGKTRDDDIIDNPVHARGGGIYISDSKSEDESLSELLLTAINKKNKKKHSGKDNTVLIIDNRTSRFEISDLKVAVEAISSELSVVSFPEIYFYTGYYSDFDGNNAEYSFSPIKLPESKGKKLLKSIKGKNLKFRGDGIVDD